jgi:diguanylate cyclase (GGDEF)-like protein
MRYKADHDALTALWNRAGALALLRDELSRASRSGAPVSLLLCDIDHFKQINDRHGHIAGDEVLRQVAYRLRESVRPHDCVGRYGGEEFLIVLGGCSEANLRRRAENIREAIGRVPFTLPETVLTVTISIGAMTIEQWDRCLLIDFYLKEADEALYQAKAAGRDCVVFAEPRLTASSHLDAVGAMPMGR